MSRPKRAYLSPRQLGALTNHGMVEARYGNRGTIRLFCVTDKTKVYSKVASDDDGEQIPVLLFPEEQWETVLDTLGVDDDKDVVKVNDVVWAKESESDRWVRRDEFLDELEAAGVDLSSYRRG